MAFWLLTALIGISVVAFLVLALLRRPGAAPQTGENPDLAVYRDQLKAIDKDVARGVLAPEEAERARLEIQRRILEADRAAQTVQPVQSAPRAATVTVAALCAVAVLGGSFGLYMWLGAPGYADMPLKARIQFAEELRESRPRQAEAEQAARLPQAEADPRHLELVEKLRQTVAERGDDLRGYQLLAINESALGNFIAAREAQAKVVELKGDAASAEDYAALADLMIIAAGGYVSPEAEQALTEALRRDPGNGTARYYSGLMFMQTARPDMGFRMWRGLLADSTPQDPWYEPVMSQIAEAALRAGVEFTPPMMAEGGGALPGPSAEDMAAASEMDAEDRDAMIRGMVANLADRLATDGGSAEEWARLIRAYGVLGETGQADAIWKESQGVFAGREADLALLRDAARAAGVLQ
ncbi:hypothetical protein PSA7680_00890 [Pseudoruegeria aquimaris]|uniref:Cytochrome c-type biogenesis protein CcmH n=1 Tax=Pseudoruegeria aquimaris TaxID=393663 RepID=A0A1Y5RQ98_9RHOB|nr:c-type cytochrome biogenesis protein CcmI [Pseudoruegeria aquimaris]SLN22538.1 hypothetical protein PSA7680_00890 [Pseudoruegeria aquimaris]